MPLDHSSHQETHVIEFFFGGSCAAADCLLFALHLGLSSLFRSRGELLNHSLPSTHSLLPCPALSVALSVMGVLMNPEDTVAADPVPVER